VFRANKLCISDSFVPILLQEAHGGGLMGHFGVKKTGDVLVAHFFWSRMHRDVDRFFARCTICRKAKSLLNPHGLYMYLSVPSIPQDDFSMDFVLGLHHTQKGRDVFLLGWTYFLRWQTLLLVTRVMILHTLLICSFVKLFVCMVCKYNCF
jgi:hypothetical protein